MVRSLNVGPIFTDVEQARAFIRNSILTTVLVLSAEKWLSEAYYEQL